MQNQNSPPWYESDTTDISSDICDILHYTPKDYFKELSKSVYNQDDALKQASLFLYSHINLGVRRNILFSGETGSGKSWLIQQMQKLITNAFNEPNLFSIIDASAITSAGYRGNDVQDSYMNLRTVYFHVKHSHEREIRPILVYDEFDKILSPGMNPSAQGYSKMTQNNFLMALSGCTYNFTKDGKTRSINTSDVSHIIVGSFADVIDAAKKDNHIGIGFNTSADESKHTDYSDDFFAENLQSELWGRIDSFSTLKKMDSKDYENILMNENYIKSFEENYKVKLHLTKREIKDLAELAETKNLGCRTLNNRISNMILESYWNQSSSEFVSSDYFD